MAALVHPLFVDVVFWTFLRFVTGLCMAGLYVVAESWLNDGASNSNRGTMMSGYLVVGLGGKVLGQGLLNVAPPEGFELFVVASILVSAALIPISLSARALPPLSRPAGVRFVELLRAAPSGLATVFVSGISTAALTGLLAVQATQNGLSPARVSALVGALLVGAVGFQIPIGALSDRVERRKVILGVSVAVSVVAVGLGATDLGWFMSLAGIFVLGGFVFPLYGLGVALTNDWVRAEQRAGASVVIMVVSGSGAILGPLLGSYAITRSSTGLFWFVAIVNAVYALYLAVRILIRESVNVGDQVRFRLILERASGAVRHHTVGRRPPTG